jgi:hypothetical protein
MQLGLGTMQRRGQKYWKAHTVKSWQHRAHLRKRCTHDRECLPLLQVCAHEGTSNFLETDPLWGTAHREGEPQKHIPVASFVWMTENKKDIEKYWRWSETKDTLHHEKKR